MTTMKHLLTFALLATTAAALPEPDMQHHRDIARRLVEKSTIIPSDDFVKARSNSIPLAKNKKRGGKKCPASSSFASSSAAPAPTDTGVENTASSPAKGSGGGSRLDQIKDMYAFTGFVYSLESCKSKSDMTGDFKDMKSKGARAAITFGSCQGQDSQSHYADVISASSSAGIKIIMLVNTLLSNGGSISSTVIPRMDNIAKAIIANPDNVLAVALGDEPMFDNDFGSVDSLVSTIKSLKGKFSAAGLDIPVSVSDMAFGYQTAGQKSKSSPVPQAVDFFMVNNFPYFAPGATSGGSDGAWKSFTGDISFFESISGGKPILVTQTGWPSNKLEFAPNSNSIQATTSSMQGYWNLLDGHCSDYFKSKNIGWMWRDYDDTIQGWGVKDANGNDKFNVQAKQTC